MGIFDRDDEEASGEVRINAVEPEQKEKDNSRLKQEAEEKLTSRSAGSSLSDSGSDSDTSGMLPGMGSSADDSTTDVNSGRSSGSGVDIDDIHSQNERIIELLQDIKSELGGSTQNGLL